jgi:pSer/pThr/pTyr-binding forkhead associated (FHA) protein
MDTPYRTADRRLHRTSSPRTSDKWDVTLEILRGRARSRERRVQSTAYLIGTADDCDLVLGDPQFADVHACLLLRADGVWLRHLGFVPDITVNGTTVGRTLLADGDRIRTGPFEFAVRIRRRNLEHGSDDPKSGVSRGSHRLRIHPATREAEVVGQVSELVADIRAALWPDGSDVRLYVEPVDGSRSAAHPLLPATWMTTLRHQARGA